MKKSIAQFLKPGTFIRVLLLFFIILCFASSLSAQKRRKSYSHTQTKSANPVQIADSYTNSSNKKILDLLLNDAQKVKVGTPEMTSLLMKISELYDKVPTRDKKAFINVIYQHVENIKEKEEKRGEFASLSHIFEFFADATDSRLPTVFYMQGEISAIEPFDTIKLNYCIDKLLNFEKNTGYRQSEYIENLKRSREYIRNIVPLSKDMDGIWVSDLYSEKTGMPYYVLKVENGVISLSTFSGCLQGLSNTDANMLKLPQQVQDIGVNSTYLAFCSENMSSPSALVQELIINAKNSVNNVVYSSIMNGLAKDGVGGQLAGGFVSGAINSGIDALVKELTTPKKQIYSIEMNIHKCSPDELFAQSNWKYIYIKGENTPEVQEENYIISFVRWTPESNVYFTFSDGDIFPIWLGKNDYYSKAEMKNLKKNPNWDFRNDYILLSKTGKIKAYNLMMLKKLIFQTEQKAVNNGFELPPQKNHFRKIAVMGVGFMTEEERSKLVKKKGKQKKHEDDDNVIESKGVLISEVIDNSPAQLFGIKKGDVITHIDGYPIKTGEDAISYINSLSPYSYIKIKFQRKGKDKEINLPLTYMLK